MLIELSYQDKYDIARITAQLVRQQLQSAIAQQYPERVSCKEAARILGITPGHLRKIASRYPHTKTTEGKQGRLLFVRDALFNPPT